MRVGRAIITTVCAVSAVIAVGTTKDAHAAGTFSVCESICQFTQIQPALNAASNGDTISVGVGTYVGHLTIDKSITMVGVRSDLTVITKGNPVVTISKGAAVIMRNLTIADGAGGMLNQGTVYMQGVTVRDNTGGLAFGGLRAEPGSVTTMQSVTVSTNAGLAGGGMSVSVGAIVTGTDVALDANKASLGGGIDNQGTVSLTRGTILRNIAGTIGGGIFNRGKLTLTDSRVAGNQACPTPEVCGGASPTNAGGGIYNVSPADGVPAPYGTVSLTNTLVVNNLPNNCTGCAVAGPGPGSPLSTVQAFPIVSGGAGGRSAEFDVSFSSTRPGQGYVLFGPGSGCRGLVGIATQDLGAGTTQHLISVTGDEMNLMAGAVLPGATYSYEVETVTQSGVEIDNNGGKCYTVTIPSD